MCGIVVVAPGSRPPLMLCRFRGGRHQQPVRGHNLRADEGAGDGGFRIRFSSCTSVIVDDVVRIVVPLEQLCHFILRAAHGVQRRAQRVDRLPLNVEELVMGLPLLEHGPQVRLSVVSHAISVA